MENATVTGYVSHSQVSKSGKHLVCTLMPDNETLAEKIRYSMLESPDAEVPNGTQIINGVFEYAKNADGEFIEPDLHKTEDGRELEYHIGYLTSAEKIVKSTGSRGRLAKMLADQEEEG
jgi:hypothetical protein